MKPQSEETTDMSLEQERKEIHALSQKTPIQLGLILALLGMCVGGFGAWIWWAASISTKLDAVLSQQSALVVATQKQNSDIEDLKAWRKLVDVVGTASMAQKTKELDAKIAEIERKIELHEVKTGSISKP